MFTYYNSYLQRLDTFTFEKNNVTQSYMNNIFMVAGVIMTIFVVFKMVENNAVESENKPLKHIFRDGLVVFVSACVGIFSYEQISNLNNEINTGVPTVFTNSPDF
uniref:Uncharacterized protein n=1 Tax=viral metagenome TaxID=1070528 RepID=A0A6C0J9Q8_9ZZZZ